jgi:alpha-methylacyl-CoA racemase
MGPLSGFKVLELESIGPVPFCGMMLADMGADVLLVDRPADPMLGLALPRRHDVMLRGHRSITLDLKTLDGVAALLELAGRADALIEGFRPGVLERLGLTPEALLARNPNLVIGRMTGWGQEGPLAPRAGHDIDYIALSGALNAIGHAQGRPVPPLNLVGDFGGGGMLLACGVLAALLEASRSGKGQVVDAAMVDGASLLTTMFWGLIAGGQWDAARGANILDSGAPWYDTYETADGRFVAIGAIEPKFYAELLSRLGLTHDDLPAQHDRNGWPVLRARFAQVLKKKSRDEWCRIFDDADACFAPVLGFDEAGAHPHNVARRSHVKVGDVLQPAPAPRFSRTPSEIRNVPPERGTAGAAALADWGFAPAEIDALRTRGVGCGTA